MKTKPLVSVIMPAYNAADVLPDAVNSVLKQTYNLLELIIVDDFSSDKTYEIAKAFMDRDKRVYVYKNDINCGVSRTRNYGVSIAKGDWIAFLDSDDMWREDKLEKQVSFVVSNPDAMISYTASAFIDFYGNRYGYEMPAELKMTYSMLLKRNLLSCSSVMVRSDIMKRYNMERDDTHEDYVTWLKILKETSFAYGINEPLLIYRLSPNSKSSNRIRSAKMIFQSYRCVGYDPVTSFVLMLQYSLHSIKKRLLIAASKSWGDKE